MTTNVSSDGPQLGRSVTINKASQLLCVSQGTIYNWIRSGKLQTIKTIGGSQRVINESISQIQPREEIRHRPPRPEARQKDNYAVNDPRKYEGPCVKGVGYNAFRTMYRDGLIGFGDLVVFPHYEIQPTGQNRVLLYGIVTGCGMLSVSRSLDDLENASYICGSGAIKKFGWFAVKKDQIAKLQRFQRER